MDINGILKRPIVDTLPYISVGPHWAHRIVITKTKWERPKAPATIMKYR